MMMSMRAAVVLLVLATVAPVGCRKPPARAPAPAPVAATPPDTRPRLSVEVEPADAEILIDDVPIGTGASVSSVPLDPGLHQIIVRKAGYDTYRAEVTIEDGGGDESIHVELEPGND